MQAVSGGKTRDKEGLEGRWKTRQRHGHGQIEREGDYEEKKRKGRERDIENVSVLMEFAILLQPLAVVVAVADRWIMNTV